MMLHAAVRVPVTSLIRPPTLCLLGNHAPGVSAALRKNYEVVYHPTTRADYVVSKYSNPMTCIYMTLGAFCRQPNVVMWIDDSELTEKDIQRLECVSWVNFIHTSSGNVPDDILEALKRTDDTASSL